ncbi:MAG: glycosyltransferase family 2 protein [Desulfobacterales bacterium]|nr:glycosyltransferase family 2 protein [Desulfobacterales bacterium]
MMIQATIVIPTRNRARSLEKAIAAFARQDFPRTGYEILVVDNGSTDDTAEVAAKAGAENPGLNLRGVYEPVPGLLSGRHRGALEARGDLLCFVDDDIEVATTWLSAIVETFTDEAVHLVGGPSEPRFEAVPPAWMDRFVDRRNGRINCGDLSLFDIGDRTVPIDPTYVWGLNFSIRKQTLFDLGGFHPDCIPKQLQHFQGDGETGLALKIRKKGLAAVYVAGARVVHHIPRERLTVAYFEDRYFYQGVCDSYTGIREERGVGDEIDCPSTGPVAIPTDGTLYDRYRRIVYDRIQAAHAAGFQFHQEAVRADRRLLDWVLRDDYLDFLLPDLGTGDGSGGNEAPIEAGQTTDPMIAEQLTPRISQVA